MCGLAGLLSAEPGGCAIVTRMVQALRHRGPDGHGVISLPLPRSRYLHLGHARLNVIDLSDAGTQPMVDRARGHVLVFNGEVYNYRDLRRELEAGGETFHSRTDTEVVLKAWARWGERALERMRGMFALAFWDASARRLHLARDRLGLKPLYLARTDRGDVLFASEVRALLRSGRIPRRLDRAGLAIYLWNGFVVAPHTLVDGITSLLPGTLLTLDEDGRNVQERRYWTPPRPASHIPDLGEAREALRHRFDEAVRLRLEAEVPLGAFLSGGLDSSAIVASMVRQGADVRSFSITFDEAAFDESRYARALAARTGHSHHEVRLTRARFLAQLDDALDAFDQPSFDGVNQYFVSRVAREAGLTVALSGLGADELFGGYPLFAHAPRMVRASRWLGRVPAGVRRWLGPLFDPGGQDGLRAQNGRGKLIDLLAASPLSVTHAYQLVNALFRRDFIAKLFREDPISIPAWGLPEAWFDSAQEPDPARDPVEATNGSREILTRLCLRLFLGERCLRDADTTSMASSLEVRAPFTDHLFVECALSIPARHRTAGPPHKRFEAELFGPDLPEAIRRRTKQGFTFPLAMWLRDALYPRAAETLHNRVALTDLGLDPEPAARLLRAFRRGNPAVPWSRVWALHVLVRWCQKHGISIDGSVRPGEAECEAPVHDITPVVALAAEELAVRT